MERFWRWLGVALGKHWKFVAAMVVVITVVLGFGARNIDFATGQDSYLNPDSQIAIDNVAFQEDFGGETVILLFTSNDGSDVTKLYEGANLEELTRITDELHDVEGSDAIITPLTSLTFSANLLSGGVQSVGSSALLSAAARDEAGAEARQADITTALARLGGIPEEERVIGNPAYNELLIYDNGGFTVAEDGTVVPPPDAELRIRKSLASTFPNVEGGIVNGTAVGGVVLEGNADLDTQTAGTKQVIEILKDAQFEGFDLTVTGAPVYLADLNDYLQGGMLSLGAAALVLMAIVLLVMFRVRWRLLPLLAVDHRCALVVLDPRDDRHQPVARHHLGSADPHRDGHRLRDPDPQPCRGRGGARQGGASRSPRRWPTLHRHCSRRRSPLWLHSSRCASPRCP